MVASSPPGSVHTLPLDALRAPSVTVWSAWEGDEILGCGALKELDVSTGEIKSMCTATVHRGRGVAHAILQHMLGIAQQRAYETVYLETGSAPAFDPAKALYEKAGFVACGPFADYVEDSFSRFMTLQL